MSCKEIIRVGITSIGSGVGQSIINSCRLSEMPLYTVGFGSNPMAFGAYDCDAIDFLPTIYAPEYIDELLKLCEKYKIDVLIPGLDDELYNISLNLERFRNIGVVPIVASPEMIELCRDKVKMSNVLREISSYFVNSYNKQSLLEQYKSNAVTFPLIAKPRSGMASRGVFFINSAEEFDLISDDHVVQEIAMPHAGDVNYKSYMDNLKKGIITQVSEVSVQFVIGKNKNIIGKCATFNKLVNGVPIEVIPFDDEEMWKSLESVMPYFLSIGLQGPINIQGRMTDNGPKFFEMNVRFTGITGLRAIMGFNEVEALIKNFLELELPTQGVELNSKRLGIRQVSDRAIVFGRSAELDKMAIKTGYYPGSRIGISVMVSGATGFLGKSIVEKLVEREDVSYVICLVRDKEKAEDLFKTNSKIKYVTTTEIENGLFNLGNVEVLINAAFATIEYGVPKIVESLDFVNRLLINAGKHHVPAIINISSQAVYGTNYPPLWKEELSPEPLIPYACAKLTSEILTANISSQYKQTCSTSIRLARIIGPGAKRDQLFSIFMSAAWEAGEIKIKGGSQMLDLLDVRDAAEGIVGLLNISATEWKPVYNMGSGFGLNIVKIAEEANAAAKLRGRKGAEIFVEPQDIIMNYGMSIEKIAQDTGWSPKISLRQSFIDSAEAAYSV